MVVVHPAATHRTFLCFLLFSPFCSTFLIEVVTTKVNKRSENPKD